MTTKTFYAYIITDIDEIREVLAQPRHDVMVALEHRPVQERLTTPVLVAMQAVGDEATTEHDVVVADGLVDPQHLFL